MKFLILERLDFADFYRKELPDLENGRGDEATAKCPFHEETDPSFSVNLKSGLFNCFGCNEAGDVFTFYQKRHNCSFNAGLKDLARMYDIDQVQQKPKRKIIATYDYHDAEEKLIFQVVRFEPKGFSQRRPDGEGGWIWGLSAEEYGRRQGGRDWYKVQDGQSCAETRNFPVCTKVPYCLPEVLKAQTVLIPEGEKDADNLACLGLPEGWAVSTNPQSAGKWPDDFERHFQAKAVIILPDNDDPGRKHAQDVARNLHGVATSVKVVELSGLPEKGDVSDWLAAGGTVEQLKALVDATREWTPPADDGQAYDQAERESSQGGAQAPKFPGIISAADLQNLVFPEIEYLIEDIMPLGFGLLSARPKKGKSFLALNVSAAKSTGGCAFGTKELRLEPGKVLYIAYEDKNQRIKNRLTTIMQGEPFPPKLYVAESWPRFPDGGLDRLDKWLTSNPDAKLVVIDTLGRFKPRKRPRQDDYEADLTTGAALADLAHKHNVCILGIYHNRKTESDDPLDDVHGSTGMTAAADFVMVLKRGRGQADADLFVTGRDIEEKTLALRFHKREGLWELLGTAEDVAKSQSRKEIFLILKENGPMTTKELSEIINKKVDTIKKLLNRMKVDNELRFRNGKWELM